MKNKRLLLLICSLLVLSTVIAFSDLVHQEFVNYDDDLYITENLPVQKGLSRQGLIWAFTSDHAWNWHPLTWLSHMLDCELYGTNPAGHKITNLLLHLFNVLLLFILWTRMTGHIWASAFVAFVFAVHPLHVESVAWISERKDVLSTFFCLWTIWMYTRYVANPSLRTYLVVIVFFMMALLSKPMAVTLPFVLLLLDYWPLGRHANAIKEPSARNTGHPKKNNFFQLLLEKVPLFVMSGVIAFVTLIVQEATKSHHVPSLGIRVANACVSYLRYMEKTIWPKDLAVLYPYPDGYALWLVIGAAAFLLILSLFASLVAVKRPYLFVGWWWYLGTLFPVIGLIQVGSQAMADRYMYLPMVGLLVITAWGVPRLFANIRFVKTALGLLAGAGILFLVLLTRQQVGHWKNSIQLFSHTLQVTSNNALAHNNLGKAFHHVGRLEEAYSHYTEALQIMPNFAEALNNLGNLLMEMGRPDDAIAHYKKALKIWPDFSAAHNNLGTLLDRLGRYDEAATHYFEALLTNPKSARYHCNLGVTLVNKGKLDEAIVHYRKALQIWPDFAEAHNNLGTAFARQGDLKGAFTQFLEAVRLEPQYVDAQKNLGTAYIQMGNLNKAIQTLFMALQMAPNDAGLLGTLGAALYQQNRFDKSMQYLSKALELDPENKDIRHNLHLVLKRIAPVKKTENGTESGGRRAP